MGLPSISNRRTRPVATWIGAQASSGAGPSYSQSFRAPSGDAGSVPSGECHWAMSAPSICRRGLGRTVRCFKSPFLINHRNSHGRHCRRLTERLTSCSIVNFLIAGGISVSLLFRRLSTLSAPSLNSSPEIAVSELPARNRRRKGSSEL